LGAGGVWGRVKEERKGVRQGEKRLEEVVGRAKWLVGGGGGGGVLRAKVRVGGGKDGVKRVYGGEGGINRLIKRVDLEQQ